MSDERYFDSQNEAANGNNLVEKSNNLNSLMCDDMELLELRFFLMYVSKLNPLDVENRTISIKIDEFEKFFNVKFNTTLFTRKIKQVLHRSVTIRTGDTNSEINLYSKFEWSLRESKELLITCNYDIVPYLFELQKNYTAYMIENIAKLNTVSKIRLYEVCKQYEKLGTVRLELPLLQQMLCSRMRDFRNFRAQILDPAVNDVTKHTDIVVTYQKILSCRRVAAIRFTIQSKEELEKLEEAKRLAEEAARAEAEAQKAAQKAKELESRPPIENYSEDVVSIYQTCSEHYSLEEVKKLLAFAKTINPDNPQFCVLGACLNVEASGKHIKNWYRYTLKVMQADYINSQAKLKAQAERSAQERKKKDPYYIEPSYDLDEWNTIVDTSDRKMSY